MTGHGVTGGASAALLASGHTLVVAAHVAGAAITVVLAFMATTAQGIASEAMNARAGGHAIYNLTFGIDATGTWMALFVRIDAMASGEWVASKTGWTTADRNMIPWLAISVGATSTHTRIHAAIILALQITTTIHIVQAFATITVSQRIAAMTGWTGTDRATARRLLANSIHAAWIAMTAISVAG